MSDTEVRLLELSPAQQLAQLQHQHATLTQQQRAAAAAAQHHAAAAHHQHMQLRE